MPTAATPRDKQDTVTLGMTDGNWDSVLVVGDNTNNGGEDETIKHKDSGNGGQAEAKAGCV